MITLNHNILNACLPYAKQKDINRFLEPLNHTIFRYNINTPDRLAAFIAQIAHESNNLSATEENLNYSAKSLIQVFPKYFTHEDAIAFAYKPEKIANRVYANRMGNGDEASGDGWKYRGKGLIQLTGKNNQLSIANKLQTTADQLHVPTYAALSAGEYWESHGLNELADQSKFEEITRKINGGLNGQDDRVKKWKHCKKTLGI